MIAWLVRQLERLEDRLRERRERARVQEDQEAHISALRARNKAQTDEIRHLTRANKEVRKRLDEARADRDRWERLVDSEGMTTTTGEGDQTDAQVQARRGDHG